MTRIYLRSRRSITVQESYQEVQEWLDGASHDFQGTLNSGRKITVRCASIDYLEDRS